MQIRAQEKLSSATIAARQHFFGLDNVDPASGAVREDRVLLSWMGVSSFAASFNGHVVLLDAWIPRPSGCFPEGVPCPGNWKHSMKYIGTTPAEVGALRPEVYFFGHGHFDHCGDLPAVLDANPDILVVGAEEHGNDIKAQVSGVDFMPVFKAGAPFGDTNELGNGLFADLEITAVIQPHSQAPDLAEREQFKASFDCSAFEQYPPDPNDPLSFGGLTSGMISIAWQFRIGDFALMWQDTSGPIKGTPVPAAFARLPQTDVRLGAIGFGFLSGRAVMNDHIEVLKPKIFVPLHGDPCFFKIKKELEGRLDMLPAETRPMLWFISDPGDYLRPLSFDPHAQAWSK